jgi:hypothetical protein
MSRHETPMIKRLRYGSLVNKTLYDTLIGDANSFRLTYRFSRLIFGYFVLVEFFYSVLQRPNYNSFLVKL